MKVIGSRLGSHKQKGRKSLFPQGKTSNGYNSGSIKHSVYHGVFGYGGSNGGPPSLSHDWKCDHDN